MTTVSNLSGFTDEGHAALGGLRRALALLLHSVGADPSQPQDISRKFALDKTLTWRISRLIGDSDPWEAANHVPRRPSMELLVQAMARRGAPPERVADVWAALDTFEGFVDRHAGDRETLEIIVNSTAKPAAARRMEAFRKDGYLANSAIWGVRARAQVALRVVVPNREDPTWVDLVTICGLVEFRRLRADVPWAIASIYSWGEHRAGEPGYTIPLALADQDAAPGIPLLPEFCTTPLPAMHAMAAGPNTTRFMLSNGPVGNTAAADVILGWRNVRTAPIHAAFPDEFGEHGAHLNTPAELFVHDLYVHRSLAFAMNPSVAVYGTMPGGPSYSAQDSDASMLNVPTEVADLGAAPPNTLCTELPASQAIADYAFRAAGFPAEEFHGYRFRLKYPPIPALSVMRHKLLPPA
jgi:hypothetical protein